MSKKNEKKAAEVTSAKVEMIDIFKTTYHRYRHWIRSILTEGKVNKFRFVKDDIGYTGILSVEKSEAEKTKKILSDYKTKNPDSIDMWWKI